MSTALQLNLSCGQTDLYPAARQAMSQSLPNPIYYPPFHDVEGDCVGMLAEILHTDGDVLLRSARPPTARRRRSTPSWSAATSA